MAPEEADDDLYRSGRAAYARGDWDEARTALGGFLNRECRSPRAVCRVVTLELARAERRSGHPAAAAIAFDVLLLEALADERRTVVAERDEAVAAMRSEWAKSKENLPILVRFRDRAPGFEAQDGVIFIDGRKVFDDRVPGVHFEGWVPLASISLALGEHLLEVRVRFIDRSQTGKRGTFTVRVRAPLAVSKGPVVVEIASGEETSTTRRSGSPILNVIVEQGTQPR